MIDLKTKGIILFIVGSILFSCSAYARRIKGDGRYFTSEAVDIAASSPEQKSNNPFTIHFGDKFIISGNVRVFKNREEIDFINKEIEEFVLSLTGANAIVSISAPMPFPGADGERIRVYRFDVETDNGVVGIYLKWLEDDIEGERFERASELGIAPESCYIPLGYVVSSHFEGTELSDLVLHEDWIVSRDNYSWLFTELGYLTAVLEKNGFDYNDWGAFNIIVNSDAREVRIIDFENAQVKTSNGNLVFVKDVASLFTQIKVLVENLFGIDIGLRREMIQIFETAHLEEMDKEI